MLRGGVSDRRGPCYLLAPGFSARACLGETTVVEGLAFGQPY